MITYPDGSKQFVVMVVENNRHWHEFLANTFASKGVAVMPTDYHEDASILLSFNLDKVDLIVLNPCMSMPFLYDANLILPELLKLTRGSRIRILGCSNDSMTRGRLRQEGCTHVLPKEETSLPKQLTDILEEIGRDHIKDRLRKSSG